MRYLFAELKKTAQMFPRMLLMAVLLMALIGGVAFCGVKAMDKEPLAVGADIGIVVRGDNRMTRMALAYVENMESAAKLCRFVQVSEEEGMRKLEGGELAALVLLPEELVEGIMNGQNPTVDVVFPKDARIEALLFRELTESGAGLLRVAQAQIYGAADTAAQYGLEEELAAMETEIDSYNLAFAPDRLALYDEETASATGRLSTAQYYAAAGAVLFLLLAGMAAYPVMQPEPAVFRRQLAGEGVGLSWQSMCRWLCGFLYLFCLAGFAWLVLRVAALLAPDLTGRLAEILVSGRNRVPAGVRASMILLVLAAVTAFQCMIYSLAGSRTGSILLVFLLSVGMVYLSGGFVPSALLPQTMGAVGDVLPTACMIRACGGLLAGSGAGMGRCAVGLCLYAAAFGMAACLTERFRSRRFG